MFKQPVKYLTTNRGRKLIYRLTSVGVIGIGSFTFLPETIFVKNYVDFVHNYSHGKKVELSEKLEKRFAHCKELVQMGQVQRNTLRAFSVCGFDIHHKGLTRNKFGAYVGIPVNYEYETIDDIDKKNTLINHKRVDWKSQKGKQLAESLVLPEKLQIFAMCREIITLRSWKAVIHSILTPFSILCVYGATTTLNIRLKLFEKAPLLRYTMYALVFTFGLGTYFLIKDFSEVYYEIEADKELCRMNPEFIQSGVDFYDKLIKRNVSLRHFMGAEGKKKYTALGNDNFFLRYRKIPIVARKQYFVERLQKLNQGEVEKSSDSFSIFSFLDNINIMPPMRPKQG